jgi:hypothetical protein
MVEGVIVVQRYDSRFEMLITAVDAQGSRQVASANTMARPCNTLA